MKAVILAGGLGTRLAEETQLRPKPMIEVGGHPLLWHIMKLYGHHGVREFIICLGYKGYVVKEYFLNFFAHNADVTVDLSSGGYKVHQSISEPWSVTLVDTGAHSMTGGRLGRVRPYLDGDTFCMTYGDGLADLDVAGLLAFHDQHGRAATVTAVQPPGRFGVLQVESDGQVTRFAEKPNEEIGWINGGFFVLEPSVLDRIEGDATVWERDPMESLARDGALAAYQHHGFWQACDTLRDKLYLEELWASGRPPWRVW